MKLIIVWMECQNNVYVIPESIRRKDLGYKSERTTRIHADDAGCGPGLASVILSVGMCRYVKKWVPYL